MEEWNAADIVRLVPATEDGMSLGSGGHNGASGSKRVEAGMQN
jgi:hypothetical protein